jgi:N-acetylmuramoyl-L-alanine amidase
MIEAPQQGATVQGIIPIIGWAVDDNGEVRVTLQVDGVPDGSQIAGIPRPDVAAVFPQYPNSGNSGFRIDLDTRTLTDRFHQITVTFQDRLGATSTPQTILIYVLNRP